MFHSAAKSFKTPINCKVPFDDFKNNVLLWTPTDIDAYKKKYRDLNPFHLLLEAADATKDKIDTRSKIAFLMEHANRLNIDVNGVFNAEGLPVHLDWNNTPLSNCIAYENLDLIPTFLDAAAKEGLEVDLNLQDKKGKTPLMFAIKLGWAPIEIIKRLISPSNYNVPEMSGMTPMMLACALRRADIAELLIQQEAKTLGLGDIDISNISFEQKEALNDFIHQAHPKSGKTLGHYSVIRSGNLKSQQDYNLDYQETVLNILKAAGVDGFRDINARYNCITSILREPVRCQPDIGEGVVTHIAHIELGDQSGNVYLNSHHNEMLFKTIYPCIDWPLKNHFMALFSSFAKKSMIDSMLENTQGMINFLHNLGFDFSIKQKNGKTVFEYIEGLKDGKFETFVSSSDRKYLWNLENIGKSMTSSSFFAHQIPQNSDAVKEAGARTTPSL